MATKAELQTLQNLVQSVLQDGVTDAEAQSVLSMANQIGATPQRLALMAGLPESEVRAAINRFSPGNALLDYEMGFTNPYTTNNAATVNNAAANNAAVNNAATVNNAAASNTRTFTDPITGRTMDVVANDPRLAGKTDSEIISMLFGSATNGTSNAATNNTATNNAANNTVNNNAGDISFTGDNVLTAAAKGINNFNNNPGALGFSDLNPIVTGAENTTQTAIPEFLKPILADAANAQQGALRSYVDLLTQDNARCHLSIKNQNMSLAMAADLARNDPNNFLGTTQNVLQEAARGDEVMPLFQRGREFLESGDIIDNLRTMGTTNPLEIIRGEMDSLAGIARGANDISGVGRSTLENIAMGNTPIGGQGRSTWKALPEETFYTAVKVSTLRLMQQAEPPCQVSIPLLPWADLAQ